MTWSYDPISIGIGTSAERLNAVRALIQDTDTNDQLLQDEEITFYLAQSQNDIYLAAAQACESISAKYARYGDTDIDNGGIAIDFKAVSEQYKTLGAQMRRSSKKYGSAGIGMPSAGGISRNDMLTQYDDTDRVDPAFRHRQFRNPDGFASDDEDDRIR